MKYLKNFNDKNDFYRFVSYRIKQIRESYKYSQEFTSEKINMSLGNLSKLERSISKCSLHTLFAFCDLFNITIEEFFHLDEKKYLNKIDENISKMTNENIKSVISTLETLTDYYKQFDN